MSTETLRVPDVHTIGQALLFSPEIEPLIKAEEAGGLYTAQRLKTQRPEAYAAVIQLLGADVGLQRIGKLLGIHHLTAAAVRDQEPEAIDTVRSKMVNKFRTAVLLQVERLIEHPELVPYNVAGLIIAQLTDKAELLDGRATQRVERTERVDIYASWHDTVEKLLDPTSVVEIEAPGIGLGEGNVSAIRAGIGAGGLASGPGCIDAESADSMTHASGNGDEATTSDTVSSADLGSAGELDRGAGQGGEGVAIAEGGPHSPIYTNTQKFCGNGPSSPTSPTG